MKIKTVLNVLAGLCTILLLTACPGSDGPEIELEISPKSLTLNSDNSNEASFSVTSNTRWSVSSSDTWLTASPGSGTGSITVIVRAQANNTGVSRNATLTITDQTGQVSRQCAVTQEAPAPVPDNKYLRVSPESIDIDKDGGSKDITVESNTSWNVKSDQSWAKPSASQGTDNGTVSLVIDPNSDSKEREATITFTGTGVSSPVSVKIKQYSEVILNAEVDNSSFKQSGDQTTLHIVSNISWTVSISSIDGKWLAASQEYGTGNQNITLSAGANSGQKARTATVTVTATNAKDVPSVDIKITQGGAEPYLETDKTSLPEFEVEGGTGKFTISSNISWKVSSNQTWCKANKTKGSNDSDITVTIEPNTTASDMNRTATITVESEGVTPVIKRTVSVTQKSPYLTVNKTSLPKYEPSGGNDMFTINSNVSWTVKSDQTWCRVSKSSGSNNSDITVTVDANTTYNDRDASITVEGGGIKRTVTVTQGHVDKPFLTVNKAKEINVNFDSKNAGSKTFSIESNVQWTASSNADWCTVSPTNGSNNNNSVEVRVTENKGSNERKAKITVTGGGITCSVNVTQPGEGEVLTVDKSSISLARSADSNSFNITSNLSWTITKSSGATWLTVDPESGSNNGKISVSASENTTENGRKATITVKGGSIERTIDVSQEPTTLEVSPNSLSFDSDGGEKTLNVTSNAQWTVESDQNWCTVSPANGSVIVSTKTNDTSSPRKATITVRAGDVVRTVEVTQGIPEPYLELYPTYLEFKSEGGSQECTISSNVSWTVNSNQSWCTVSKSSGSNDETITITVSAGTSEREAEVTVTGGGFTRKITVKQLKPDKVIPNENDNQLPDYSRKRK